MRYEKCSDCPKLGIECIGPHLFKLKALEVLNWCKKRKASQGLSNSKLAEMSGVPKGTIDRLLSGEHYDFKYETVQPIAEALAGDKWGALPCEARVSQENFRLLEENERLLKENRILTEKLAAFKKENSRLMSQVGKIEQRHEKEIAEMREEDRRKFQFFTDLLQRRGRTITILCILLIIAVVLGFTAIIIDATNHNVGFFWLKEAVSGTLQQIVPDVNSL